jgi:hypothetical protein
MFTVILITCLNIFGVTINVFHLLLKREHAESYTNRELSLDGPLKSLHFSDHNSIKGTRGQKMSKNDVFCFCMWSIYFSTNFDALFYFMLIRLKIKFKKTAVKRVGPFYLSNHKS